MKKVNLNQHGFTHIMLAGVFIVLGIALFGTYQFVKSNADTFSARPTNGTTQPSGTGTSQSTAANAAAASAQEVNGSGSRVAAPTKAKCSSLGRVWSQNVCAWSSTNQPVGNRFCVNKKYVYAKSNPYDRCYSPSEPQH